jgi:glutathione synthase/RimK-type ligase-like ATP-grasp enzyme
MKFALNKEGNFNTYWIDHLQKNEILFDFVDCFDTNIIKIIREKEITHLLWNWNHTDYRAMIVAFGITKAVEKMGVIVYPSSESAYHFDNKVLQKYLFEACNSPLVNSYVFYHKDQAIEWARNTSYPKVFKLKGGAGSSNVKIVRNKSNAVRLVKRSFSYGFERMNRIEFFKDRIRVLKMEKNLISFLKLIKGFFELLRKLEIDKNLGKEKGYCYFQDFIPNNDSDIRIIIIGEKAFGIKRFVKEKDFRASGSGKISHKPEDINQDCVKLAFEIKKQITGGLVCAFDFVIDCNTPKLVEISNNFVTEAYLDCPGYWDENLIFHEEFIPLPNYIINSMIE